jgi:carboxyl-terminal processing protease
VGYRILSTLTNQPFEVGASSTRDYKPAIRAWGRTEPAFKFETRKIPADAQLHFAGKVVVLSAAQTYSAAEDFLVAFDLMQRGMILGEASGGSTGQPLLINLPGGGMATIVSKHDTYPDGKAFVGVGVQVGRRVLHNLKDFRANRDTVLEAAIAELK